LLKKWNYKFFKPKKILKEDRRMSLVSRKNITNKIFEGYGEISRIRGYSFWINTSREFSPYVRNYIHDFIKDFFTWTEWGEKWSGIESSVESYLRAQKEKVNKLLRLRDKAGFQKEYSKDVDEVVEIFEVVKERILNFKIKN